MHDNGQGSSVPVAVLFSGGLDSMILAAILHECLDARCMCMIYIRILSFNYKSFVC